MDVGIFGGTFDPPHIGHLIIAQEALEQARLDCVVFIPAMVPPHKRDARVSPFPLRLAMVHAATSTNPRFSVSDIEATLPPPSFTVDTLRALRRAEPEWRDLHLIIGSDSLLELPTWRMPEEVLRMARLVVYPRAVPGATDPSPAYAAGALFLDASHLPVSSSLVRQRVRSGRSARYWLPDSVWDLVVSRRLYLSEEGS
ncbi:MAG: nicotinate-nucleotide adenylyltransferase [Candidatus Eisenbacteria bacterium]|nr:nicotinate-nucleotide adenylyltransferase [Candidatus Eisenbacteria bacterium]